MNPNRTLDWRPRDLAGGLGEQAQVLLVASGRP
jgi:hypothetical protein